MNNKQYGYVIRSPDFLIRCTPVTLINIIIPYLPMFFLRIQKWNKQPWKKVIKE